MAGTVKFNIGGQVYDVSRSMLDQHPDTMLSKSASKLWQSNPESEIFIERNGFRFQYVLDFLRDGSVRLPITECKDAFIKELEYYGVAFDKAKIDVTKEQLAASVPSIDALTKELQGVGFEGGCADIAIYCLKEYIGRHQQASCNSKPSENVNVFINHDDELNSNYYTALCRTLHQGSDALVIKSVNVHLSRVGLALVSVTFPKLLSSGPVNLVIAAA
jgi:hypothetical protein